MTSAIYNNGCRSGYNGYAADSCGGEQAARGGRHSHGGNQSHGGYQSFGGHGSNGGGNCSVGAHPIQGGIGSGAFYVGRPGTSFAGFSGGGGNGFALWQGPMNFSSETGIQAVNWGNVSFVNFGNGASQYVDNGGAGYGGGDAGYVDNGDGNGDGSVDFGYAGCGYGQGGGYVAGGNGVQGGGQNGLGSGGYIPQPQSPPPSVCDNKLTMGSFTYQFSGTTLTMTDTCSGETTTVWGDPHVTNPDGSVDTLNGNFTFNLADGTKVTVVTSNGVQDSAVQDGCVAQESWATQVVVSNGDYTSTMNADGSISVECGANDPLSQQGLQLTEVNGQWKHVDGWAACG